MIITIAGNSASGKTTLSKIVSHVVGDENCLILSGDDLHLWERGHEKWNEFTHLNPNANDLVKGFEDIKALKEGSSILRKHYNHTTGRFDEPSLLMPRQHIVYEGLHALYDENVNNISELKIFVRTDSELIYEWKIKRDMHRRGYTKDDVLKILDARKHDSKLFIETQQSNADVIVAFSKGSSSKIELKLIKGKVIENDLMQRVINLYSDITDFLEACKLISLEPHLVQGKGGNVSVKSGNSLVVTASGSRLTDVSMDREFCVCKISQIDNLTKESDYFEFVSNSKTSGIGKPSMETGLHMKMNYKFVIHTHPIHTNSILCAKESETLIASIFRDLDYDFIKYTSPGFELVNVINGDKKVYFLQNHGIVVGSNDVYEAITITKMINDRCKTWLEENIQDFMETKSNADSKELALFPDAALFLDELSLINEDILQKINKACLTPKFLSDYEKDALREMLFERYRQGKK